MTLLSSLMPVAWAQDKGQPVTQPMSITPWIWAIAAIVLLAVLFGGARSLYARRRGPRAPTPRAP
jgi:hypothetical protein